MQKIVVSYDLLGIYKDLSIYEYCQLVKEKWCYFEGKGKYCRLFQEGICPYDNSRFDNFSDDYTGFL